MRSGRFPFEEFFADDGPEERGRARWRLWKGRRFVARLSGRGTRWKPEGAKEIDLREVLG
jgi:hypothetical protein